MEELGPDEAAEADSKRQKRHLLAETKSRRKARKYAKAFPDEGLEERDEQLFCIFCNRNVPFDRKAAVRQHCEGQRKANVSFASLAEADKMAVRHHANKIQAREAAAKKNALQRAMDEQRRLLMDEAAREVAPTPPGASLPSTMLADRLEVLETFWQAGVPLNTLRKMRFLKLIEDPHVALGGVEGVRALMPLAQERAVTRVKDAVKGRRIALFIDGTKANVLIEGVVARFLDDEHCVRQVCVGVTAIRKSLNTELMMALLRKHIVETGVLFKDIVGVMSDSGQPNPASMTKWNEIARDTGLDEEEFVWVLCLMHAASNVGLTLRKLLPSVKMFMSGFKRMSNESEAARLLWLEKTGKSCKQLSDKSFWRWWKCIRDVLKVREHVSAFLREALARKVAKKSIAKMEEAWRGPLLLAQMQFCIAAGQIFRDMGVMLEGDGFCLPFVHKHVSAAQDFYAAWPRLNRSAAAQHHLIAPIHDALRGSRPNDASVAALPFTLYDVGSAVAVHADSAILQGMSSLLPVYRAGSLFHPLRFLAEAERPDFRAFLITAIDVLTSLKGVKERDVLQLKVDLNAQIISYQQACRERARHLLTVPKDDKPPELWKWWISLSAIVPAWFSVAQILVLLQPTSAAIERFFSLVKANTSPLQHHENPATFAARCMCLFNEPAHDQWPA